eukprot:scaffold60293_cov16-Tisochrysis_lutea.AAC.1
MQWSQRGLLAGNYCKTSTGKDAPGTERGNGRLWPDHLQVDLQHVQLLAVACNKIGMAVRVDGLVLNEGWLPLEPSMLAAAKPQGLKG